MNQAFPTWQGLKPRETATGVFLSSKSGEPSCPWKFLPKVYRA